MSDCSAGGSSGNFPTAPKLVIIIAPHTSAWDFVIGMAAKLAMRLDSAYLAKDSLFVWPLSILMRRTGGVPVDRSGPHNLVEQMAVRFASAKRLLLTLAPEGTRREVENWKSGFYRIAEAARVPILPIAIDFGRRVVAIGEPLTPSGDPHGDTARLKSFFEPALGHRTERS